MIQAEVLGPVLRIRYGANAASTFTLEQGAVQYLVTAKHLFRDQSYPSRVKVELLLDTGYQTKTALVFYHPLVGIDIAVMRLDSVEAVTPTYSNSYSTDGIALGQDTYFLGFPYDLDRESIKFPGRRIPVPFVKKACLSSIAAREDGSRVLYLDGHNNPGFSGGPICFKRQGSRIMSICGVVGGYRNDRRRVTDDAGNPLPMYSIENTGIVFGFDIAHAVEIITMSSSSVTPHAP